MLIQPYVENAIWHGLMLKSEGGKIAIIFEETNNLLIVTIRDNGVGREKAFLLKSASESQKHPRQSFGNRITEQRLQLLHQDHRIDTHVMIRDLYEKGKSTGTEVVIQIPII